MKRLFVLALTACLLCGYVEAKSPKLADNDVVWFLMERQPDKEKQPNDSVVVKFGTKHIFNDYYVSKVYYPVPHLMITIQNNTERTIYVDLQNSFVIPNGETFPLFTNTTDVTTQGSTVGAGVGLGIVGVASASSSSNTKVTQEQRFITIPGETKKVLDIPVVMKWRMPWILNDNCGELRFIDNGYTSYVLLQNNCIYRELKSYDGLDNPLNIDFRICYSFSPDMNPNFVNKSVFYTQYTLSAPIKYGPSNSESAEYKAAEKLFPSLEEYERQPNTLVMRLWCRPEVVGR